MQRTAALALIGLGVDAVYAEEIERILLENNLETASLDGIHWWSSQRWKFDPAAAVQEARIGWWVSPAIEFQFKRLLDTRFEADPADSTGPILVKQPIVVWDEKAERFIEVHKALMPVAQAMLQRQWAEAWRQWPRYAMNPDIGPALPVFPTLKSLIGYYERVRPQRNDPAHPAHVLRIFLEALDASKAWNEDNVERWPAGTAVDPATGAGGGRFAPKRTGTDPSSRMANYGEYLDRLRAERGPGVDVDVHLADIKEKAGERTAYAPELWPDLPPDAQAELDAFEADTAYETIERLQMYDAEGRLMGETAGEYNKVKTPVPDGFYPGCIVTHTHPNLSALSGADYSVAFNVGAREFRAVAGEYVWVAKLPVMPTKEARRAMMSTVTTEWRKAEEAAKAEVLKYMQRSREDTGPDKISPAVAGHIYGELVTQEFAAQVEPLYGIQIERQRLAPERRLTATEAKAVSGAWRADFAGMYTLDGGEVVGGRRADTAVKDSKIAVWREVPANTDNVNQLGNQEMSAKFFERAAKGGATSIMHVSDTRLSRLYLKRPLSDEERSKIVKAYEDNTQRYRGYVSQHLDAGDEYAVGSWSNLAMHETNRIRAVAWRDTAAQHPDLIEFHSDFVPGFDPVELVASEGWKPGKQNDWPFKTWDESKVERYPAGTPVDAGTGAGGGRFAPKDGSAGTAQSDERSAEQISADVMAKAEGSKGTVMPDQWPALPPETEAEIDAWHRAHVHDSFETMRIYDPAGNLVGEWAGDIYSVAYPNSVMPLPGSVIVHNHPSAISPISDLDVILATKEGIRRIEAVSGERIWSMELPVHTHFRLSTAEEIKEAYDRAFQMTDAVLKPLMNATENPLSTADANQIAREMMLRNFMREYGEDNGFKLTVRPTGTAFELSADDNALIERVLPLPDEYYGVLALSDGEIFRNRERTESDPEGAPFNAQGVIMSHKADRIIWRSDPASTWSAYRRGAISSEAFAIATKYGYSEVLGISDFAVDRLRIKRKLWPGEKQQFKEEHDRRVSEEMDRIVTQLSTQRLANETTIHSYVTKQKESSIAAKAWADMAAEYPDIFEYATAMIPSRDPLEIVKKPEFDTFNLDHDNPYAGWLSFKTWDESRVNRYPAGTPVDAGTGAGGGRFAPKNGEGSASAPRSAHGIYTDLLLKARSENREEIAAEEWPALPKSTEAEIEKFGRAVTWDGVETLRVYDAAGNLVAEAVGDHQSVTVPASATWVPGGVAVHNHPNQSGVSPRDVAMAVSTGVREIRATAGEYVWIMELPVFPDSRVRAASVGEYSAAINDTRRLANSMIGNRLDAGEITVQEANHLARAMVDDYFVERRGERLGVSLRVERLWPERPLTDAESEVIDRVRSLGETTGLYDVDGESAAVYRAPKTNRVNTAFTNREPQPSVLRMAADNGSRLVLGVSDERVSRLYLKRMPTAKELDNIEKRWNEAFAAERKRTGQRMYDEGYDLGVIDLEVDDAKVGLFQAKAWRTVADEHPDLIEYRNDWHKDLDPVELAKNDAWRNLKTNSWDRPTKAWDESAHPRHPEGTPVDESTGAGGGRFAPKDGSAPGSAGDVVAEMAGEQTAFRNEPLEGYGEGSAEPVFVWLNTIKEETGEDAAFLIVDDIYAGMATTPPRQSVVSAEKMALEQSFGYDNELAEEAAAKVAEVVDNHPVAIAMDSDAVASILADGRVKNQYETGETGGLFDPEYRIGIEGSLHGIPRDADPSARPIYGYVKFGDPMVREYGAWDAVLRDDIKDRATLTAGDSIMDNEETIKVGVPMRRVGDTIAYFGAHGEDAISIIDDGGSDYNMMEYFEVQVHGGVSLDDIDHFVPPEFEKDSDPAVIASLESHGFTFDGSVYRRTTPPAGDVVAEMAGETQTGGGSADYDVPRVWDGTQHERPEKMPSKFAVGELAENLTRQIMRDIVGDEFKTLNNGRSNAPLDVFGDHMAIEVKAGLASNGRTAQHWRATIGEPGKGEKELLAKMSPEEKKRHNAWKGKEILKRKAALVEQLAQYTSDGEPVKPVTVGMIFKPDLTAVDVYVIDGHHLYLAWNQHATEENYLDTFKVNPQWPK